MELIELRDIRKSYFLDEIEVPVLRGISMSVRRGELVALTGASGSGKSTLMHILGCLDRPSAGEYWLEGQEVGGLSANERALIRNRKIGFVFQAFNLMPRTSALDNALMPLAYTASHLSQRDKRERATAMLEKVGLADRLTHHPGQLSGGQQQRVALARAIVFQPRLLLMDEPLGALDKQLRESLQLEMRRLHADLGITFIYVTHDQQEALTMSDRIAVVNEGLIAQVGSPDDLYDRPCNRFVASFIGESNFLPGVVRGVENGHVVADCAGGIVRAVASNGAALGQAITLSTRPERMRFADARMMNGALQNRLRATISEAVFAGERCRYLCIGEGGLPIVLKEPSGADTRRRVVGETIEIAWAAADTVVV